MTFSLIPGQNLSEKAPLAERHGGYSPEMIEAARRRDAIIGAASLRVQYAPGQPQMTYPEQPAMSQPQEAVIRQLPYRSQGQSQEAVTPLFSNASNVAPEEGYDVQRAA